MFKNNVILITIKIQNTTFTSRRERTFILFVHGFFYILFNRYYGIKNISLWIDTKAIDLCFPLLLLPNMKVSQFSSINIEKWINACRQIPLWSSWIDDSFEEFCFWKSKNTIIIRVWINQISNTLTWSKFKANFLN